MSSHQKRPVVPTIFVVTWLVVTIGLATIPVTRGWTQASITIEPGTPVEFEFNGIHVLLEANVSTRVSLSVDNSLRNKWFYFQLSASASQDVTITIQKEVVEHRLVAGRDIDLGLGNRYRYASGTAMRVHSNVSGASVVAGARVDAIPGRREALRWIVKDAGAGSGDAWSLAPSTLDGDYLYTTAATGAYIAIVEMIDSTSDSWVLPVVVLAGIIIATSVLVVSKRDYLRHAVLRAGNGQRATHRLSFEEVVDHPKRSEILDMILEQPGMHFNELMRRASLDSGALSWHLGILEDYLLVRREKIGTYLAFFPRLWMDKTLPRYVDAVSIMKHHTRWELLRAIADGVRDRARLATRLSVDKATVRRHAKVLAKEGLIIVKDTNGRKESSLTPVGQEVLDTIDTLLGEPMA